VKAAAAPKPRVPGGAPKPRVPGGAESTATAVPHGRQSSLEPGAPEFFPYSGTDDERRKIDEVVPGKIYQSNYRGAEDLEKVRALGITHIVSAGNEFWEEKQEDFPLNKQGISPAVAYHQLSVDDDEAEMGAMRAVLDGAVDFIDGALRRSSQNKVLIHCAAGISRSSTVTLAYLMSQRMTLRQSFELLYVARRVVWPNDGFMRLLISLEREKAQAMQTASAKGKATQKAGAKGSAFRPTIDLAEYVAWGEYDPESYAAAKTVDRGGVGMIKSDE
jgi:hypothetical protein